MLIVSAELRFQNTKISKNYLVELLKTTKSKPTMLIYSILILGKARITFTLITPSNTSAKVMMLRVLLSLLLKNLKLNKDSILLSPEHTFKQYCQVVA